MSEFLKNLDWVALSGAVVACCTAIGSIVALVISARQNKKVSQMLDDARARETYITCPNCKKKIPLSEVNFHLPSGEIDNNLNGKPDVIE